MSDYISREAAIRAILTIKDYGNSDRANALGLAELAITTLPAADLVKVRRGRWNEYDDGENTWCCSSCGEPWVLIDGNPSQNGMNYCPNCGAKMDGGQDDG